MKKVNKLISLLLAIGSMCCFASCDSSQNVFKNSDYLQEKGKISVSPYFAYYNKGQIVSGLDEVDSDKGKSKVADDGGFCIYFAVNNSTSFAKKITAIDVDYVRDSKERDIVDACNFTMDDDIYVASNQTTIVECEFEKDFVLLESSLKELTCKTSATIEGCVIDGNAPETKAGTITASIKEAKFLSTDSMEGTLAIKNNCTTAVTPKKIKFSIVTENGTKITIDPAVMELSDTIESGSTHSLRFAINQKNISDTIKDAKDFDQMILKYQIK